MVIKVLDEFKKRTIGCEEKMAERNGRDVLGYDWTRSVRCVFAMTRDE